MTPEVQHIRNIMAGLKPGDTFIHCFHCEQGFLFSYGILKNIDEQGRYLSDYQSSSPLRPISVGPYDQLVTKISQNAYLLARMRGWPNNTDGVNQIIAFSNGNDTVLQADEWARFTAPS